MAGSATQSKRKRRKLSRKKDSDSTSNQKLSSSNTLCSEFWNYNNKHNASKNFGSNSNLGVLLLMTNISKCGFASPLRLLHIGFVYPSSYQNLVRLDFKVSVACNWLVLLDLLQNAPNLEFLVVSKSDDFLEHSLCWKEPPDYLSSHLKSLCYRGFEGLRSEVGFLKYIVKYARVLKTVTIQFSGGELKEIVL
ncbi:putative FBD-associated F-box protein At3g50710 isoform X2 [Fagus crenata]